MSSSNKPTEHFLVGDGVKPIPMLSDREAMEALDDLMVVIEALCQKWPPRETFKDSKALLL